jgi:hypothetical protein
VRAAACPDVHQLRSCPHQALLVVCCCKSRMFECVCTSHRLSAAVDSPPNPFLARLTGLSGAGKSTVACTLEHLLHERGHLTSLLDGDNIRHGLNKDLGFRCGWVGVCACVGVGGAWEGEGGGLGAVLYVSFFRAALAGPAAVTARHGSLHPLA